MEGKIWVKKILLPNYFKKFSNHIDAFHGTKYDALSSIVKYGLRPAGSKVDGKVIETVPGHIDLGRSINGKSNWAGAVFTSPSIYYAAHPIYSK